MHKCDDMSLRNNQTLNLTDTEKKSYSRHRIALTDHNQSFNSNFLVVY